MRLIEKIFTLQNQPPFDTLRHSELILTANIAKVKKYSKGATLIPKETPVQSLFIIQKGEATYDGEIISGFFGAEELMNDATLKESVIAQSDIQALIISKGYFFTLIYECPGIMIELLKYFDDNRIEQ